jgi:hypothetical protein
VRAYFKYKLYGVSTYGVYVGVLVFSGCSKPAVACCD